MWDLSACCPPHFAGSTPTLLCHLPRPSQGQLWHTRWPFQRAQGADLSGGSLLSLRPVGCTSCGGLVASTRLQMMQASVSGRWTSPQENCGHGVLALGDGQSRAEVGPSSQAMGTGLPKTAVVLLQDKA